jgi:hypothetical protein
MIEHDWGIAGVMKSGEYGGFTCPSRWVIALVKIKLGELEGRTWMISPPIWIPWRSTTLRNFVLAKGWFLCRPLWQAMWFNHETSELNSPPMQGYRWLFEWIPGKPLRVQLTS